MSRRVEIISYNQHGERVAASAARISTTAGDAGTIFERSTDVEKNRKLVANVLKSGHRSIAEHAVFTLALTNVSAVVEQFFIEHRLASFTVKSRRYVDFGRSGYYSPGNLADNDTAKDLQNLYTSHLEYLFDEYRFLVENGVPREDARFVLPYCFFSNFYCTLNARELAHLIRNIRYGHGRGLQELLEIGDELVAQLAEIMPTVVDDIAIGVTANDDRLPTWQLTPDGVPQSVTPRSTLVQNCNLDAVRLAAQLSRKSFDMATLVRDRRPRELEHATVTFGLDNLTLAGLTHIVRHRLQSIVVPSLDYVNPSRYILPESVCSQPQLRSRYVAAFERNTEVIPQLNACGFPTVYLALSGNVTSIMSTMNLRELLLFFRLRCCNRAQWEIANLADALLFELRRANPAVFAHFGPNCHVDAQCPEGKHACGRYHEVRNKYREERS